MARDVFSPLEAANASASEYIRCWDQGLFAGAFVFAIVFAAALWTYWTLASPTLGVLASLQAVADALIRIATQGGSGSFEGVRQAPSSAAGAIASFVLAGLAGIWTGAIVARPINRVRHLEGPRLLEDKEALELARRLTTSDAWVYLHPSLGLSKFVWNRHVLITGGVGAGKTQILWGVMSQILEMGKYGRKAFIFDSKGDYTAAIEEAVIISPWDARSYAWDLCADISTPESAAIFAQSMIPVKEGEFFGPAAQEILIGVLLELMHDWQHEKIRWDWSTLSQRLNLPAEELKSIMARHHPPGHRLLEDPTSTTALNILQTVSAHTRPIEQLAIAWGGKKRQLSLRKWAAEGYNGRRQIVAQGGPDPDLTRRCISAMINTLIPEVISPALPDDEQRALVFLLDEFPSLGKINVAPLIDKGRSKGCVVILGYQSIEQIKDIYGNNFANGLTTMCGTHIVCQTFMGDTQELIAGHFGKRRVAVTSFSAGASGISATQHEEQRQVVPPSLLATGLGPVRYPNGKFEIRAIVETGGCDPMLLTWQGVPMPKLRPTFVRAEWMKGVAHKPVVEEPEAPEAPVAKPSRLKLKNDKLAEMMRDLGL